MRLQKFLASRGVDSRRKCEELIRAGRVRVNGERAELGLSVGPDDAVTLDGRPIEPEPDRAVYILHKPRGVLTTVRDDRGRPTVMDFVDSELRLFPVGRLDLDSEGLVILTNDGELGHLLMHPSGHVPRVYEVTVNGFLDPAKTRTLLAGVDIGDPRPALALEVELTDEKRGSCVYRLTLGEGRKRQVRRMFEALGLKVQRLVRTRFGPVALGRLNPGTVRRLNRNEIQRLRAAASGPES